MLQVNNIEVVYANIIQVLRGVSLEVDTGKVAALLGANGAGKTTTIKAISGLLKTEEGKIVEGSIFFNDKRIDRLNPQDIAALGMSQVMEGRRVLAHLTVQENLMVFAHRRKDRGEVKRDLEMVLGYLPRIKSLYRRTSGYLSGGEQQMLVIGRALMARPKLMLLDEPSLGLSPLMMQEVYEIIRRINTERKVAILLVEQNARAALNIAEYVYVMEDGRIAMSGPSEKLMENEDIKEFYMGLSTAGAEKDYRDVKHYRRKKRWLT